ncbi:MAG TPA: hypothetical protein DCZ94_02890 [Lentisphaeria bacterium]|nr:MAG: hypothetical protein A2X48_03545 [Lentisphaerae bacterium GWF2_49_21]HBC85880.1 hypothetical protein [Lentisphaeria bacterium]
MSEPVKPLRLKIKSRVVLHTQNSRPAQMTSSSTQMPDPLPMATVAGLEELVMSGHILGMSASVQNDRFCLSACIENNPGLQFIGQGSNAEEAMADLKAKVLELGLVI